MSMDEAYQQAITEALDYLGIVGEQTNSEISDLTSAVEEQLETASAGMATALNEAKEQIVDVLNDILVAIYHEGGVTVEGLPAVSEENDEPTSFWEKIAQKISGTLTGALPSLDDGGLVLKTGMAVVHRGERFDGGQGFPSGTQITINNVYGYDDFIEKVRQTGIDINRRAIA